MDSFNPFRCIECGDTVVLVTGPGRVEEYRRGVYLPVPDDFPIPTCPTCGEAYFTVERGRALEAAQHKLYVSVARSSPI